MRDRRLHDHGEDKHPSPCLHPFCCLTFLHVFIISLTCCISLTVCLSGLSGSCFLLPSLSTPPSICLYNLWTLSLVHSKLFTSLLLAAFFCLPSPIFSPTPTSLTLFYISPLTHATFPSPHLPPSLPVWGEKKKEKKLWPWMHHLQHTEFKVLEAVEPWCISPYWFGIWIPSYLTMICFIMSALREWQFIFIWSS